MKLLNKINEPKFFKVPFLHRLKFIYLRQSFSFSFVKFFLADNDAKVVSFLLVIVRINVKLYA